MYIIVVFSQPYKLTFVTTDWRVMNFIDNFVARCEARGESPSYALEHAGLSKSFLSKMKKFPDRTPAGETLFKIASYFGCTVDDLLDSAPYSRTKTAIKIQALVDRMTPEQQDYIYRLISFVWGESNDL